MEKKKVYRQDSYNVSPWNLIYTDDFYYLLAYDATADKMKHYRVDRMNNVRVIKKERDGAEKYESHDMKDYTKFTFSMFSGEIHKVRMRFNKKLVSVVMDKFGSDVWIIPVDNDHFEVCVDIAVSPQFYGWIFGLGDQVEIIGPDAVREGMKNALTMVVNKYN